MPQLAEKKKTFSNIHTLAFGRQLYSIRTKAGINIRGFARAVDSSPAWISYIERGRRIPCWPLVEKILCFFEAQKVSHNELKHLRSLARKLLLEKTFYASVPANISKN